MAWPSNRSRSSKVEPSKEQFADLDKLAGIEVSDDFARFSQRNDLFTRAFWDPQVQSKDTDAFFASYRIEASPRRGDGFSHKDFALRNAAWAVSDMVSERSAATGKREGFQAPLEPTNDICPDAHEVEDVAAFTRELKEVARLFGADLVGVCELDERWHYSSRVDVRDFSEADNGLPQDITHVIVLGHGMDASLVRSYPSALAGAATGLEYSREASIVIQLTAYIRNLGYTAVASMNDTALAIPYAIKAGLGEYGRNQMVITPEFGPRVRFSKIFTSLPLEPDKPAKFGVETYCNACTVCADACPPKALPYGPPSFERPNQSSLQGVKKWTADCERCFGYWAKLKTDCAICMRVCPFSETPGSWRGQIFRRLVHLGTLSLARIWARRVLSLPRLKPKDWWASLSSPTDS